MEKIGRSHGRLKFIDGLRGIASAWVALYHLYGFGHLIQPLSKFFPRILTLLFIHGDLGVSIFFVISGFVMALSQRGARIDLKYFGNFALRRSLRLDPPYWLTLWAAVLLIRISAGHSPGIEKHVAIGDVVISMFYLQEFLHRPEVLNIAWTLCYEVQFYIVLTLFCAIGQRLLPKRWQTAYLLIFIPTGLWSIATYAYAGSAQPAGLFIDRWYMFVFGVLAFWSWDRQIHPGWFWGFTGIAAVVFCFRFDFEAAASVGAALLVGIVSLIPGAMENYLGNRPLQFLGRISYSLYLVHTLVGQKLMQLSVKYVHGSEFRAVLVFLVACIATVIAAWCLYFFVERWGIALGKRVKHHKSLAIPSLPTLA